MARRDVDLVIRAKDEAASVVDQITKALTKFSESTKGLDQSAEKSESTLTSLGAAIGKLERTLETAAGTDKLSANLDKAAKSLADLEGRFERTQAQADQQARSLQNAANLTERYAGKLDGATQALERQRGAVAAAQKEQKQLEAAQIKATAAIERLSARQEKLPGQIEKQAASVAKATARYDELQAALIETEKPSATLQRQFEASQRAVTQKTDRLRALEAELTSVNGELRAAGSAVTIFSAQSQNAAQNLQRQQSVLGKIEENYAGLREQVKASSGVQTRLQKDVEATSAALGKQSADLDRAEQNYVELAQSVGKADAAMSAFSQQALQGLSSQLRDQRRATLEAKREWNLAEANVKELARATREAVQPNEQLSRAFDAARQRAATAKTEYQLNAQALNRMGQAYQEAGQDIQSLGAASNRIAQTQQRLAGQLGQVADQSVRVARSVDQTDRAARTHTGTMTRLSAAYRQFYGDSRQSLSLLQRIRGEVLSLVAAYGGLYAGIEVIRGAVTATETLAGVTSRLNVAFGGDEERAGQELDFIRRQADRLGVSFTNLATEYSKFSVATKDTNLEGEATRQIFIGIAEAARVNRASQQDLQGVFTALTQIVSKGAVQMEELRQQLGDRLPGAIQLMADALGVGTDELIKMMEQGMVTSEALLPFAQQVQERFGPGLSEALESTSSSLGRLQNAAFKALTIFSDGGFIDGFQRFVDQLTETLNSDDFEAFAARAGAAMGQFFDFLAFGAENFQVLIAAASAFLALRLTPLVLAVGGAFKDVVVDIGRTAVAMTAVGTSAQGATGRIGLATAAVGRLRLALTALLSTTGIGLLVAAIGAGIALWVTEADDATEAMNAHQKIVDAVKNAYDNAGESVKDWADRIEGVTFTQALGNLQQLQTQLQSAQRSATSAIIPVSGSRDSQDQVRNLIELFRQGGLSAQEYKRALEEVADGDPLVSRDSIRALQDAADGVVELEEATVKAGAAVTLLNKNSSEAAKDSARAILGLGTAFDEAAKSASEAAQKAEDYERAMGELRDRIPEVKRELEFLEESKAIETFLQQSIQAASTWGDIAAAIRTAGQAQQALNKDFAGGIAGLSSASSGAEAAAAFLRKEEGFSATPYYDVNAYRAGFGSDTITLADGSIEKITKGMRVSVEDANRDLMRRITTEFLPSARNEVGAGAFDALTPAQQGVLVSLTYNYGNLPDSVAKAVREGMSDSGIAQTIRNLGARGLAGTKYEEGARRRSNTEAAVFESGVGEEEAIRRQEQQAEQARQEAERAAEERAEQAEATQQRLADGQFELEQLDRKNAGLERQAAIEAAIRDAKAENPNITAQELELIQQQAGALFDKEQREKEISKQKEKHVLAEERVNQLTQQRNALEAQRDIALENGDVEKAEELKNQIAGVNEELLKAIDNAILMWQAVGGGAADAAIAQLQLAKAEAAQFGQQANQNYIQWDRVGQLLQTGLTNAVNNFAKAVAEGKSVGEAARAAFLQFASDFLIQIGQMIAQQVILNALKAAFGGGNPIGALMGFGAGHTGGLVGGSRVGSGNRTRQVNPAVFASASRYHMGGLIGLAPNEVPIIAQRGEEMLTQDDPRHMLNGGFMSKMGGGASKPRPLNIINAFDAVDVMQQAASSSAGAEVLLNFVRQNRETIKAELE